MRPIALVIALSGCAFHPTAGSVEDGGGVHDGTSADASVLRTFPHLPAGEAPSATGDVMWSGAVTVNTSDGTVVPALPAGAELVLVTPDPAGPQLYLLRAHSLTVVAGATVSVRGSHALVVLADTIDIAGALDAGGHGGRPGPGAAITSTQASGAVGAGGNGVHSELTGAVGDSGGGGGGGGTAGAGGGSANIDEATCFDSALALPAGAGGVAFATPDLPVLTGGMYGGAGSPGSCPAATGGGGGGALQLSAVTSIHIAATATLSVSGGGGGGGVFCSTNDAGAGSGGGAGGAIMLDAPVLAQDGQIGANGGGGGGGGCGPTDGTGTPGANGDATAASARGGAPSQPDGCGFAGGDGAASTTAPTRGADGLCGDNGGGGGGGAGVIVFHLPSGVQPTGAGTASPPALISIW